MNNTEKTEDLISGKSKSNKNLYIIIGLLLIGIMFFVYFNFFSKDMNSLSGEDLEIYNSYLTENGNVPTNLKEFDPFGQVGWFIQGNTYTAYYEGLLPNMNLNPPDEITVIQNGNQRDVQYNNIGSGYPTGFFEVEDKLYVTFSIKNSENELNDIVIAKYNPDLESFEEIYSEDAIHYYSEIGSDADANVNIENRGYYFATVSNPVYCEGSFYYYSSGMTKDYNNQTSLTKNIMHRVDLNGKEEILKVDRVSGSFNDYPLSIISSNASGDNIYIGGASNLIRYNVSNNTLDVLMSHKGVYEDQLYRGFYIASVSEESGIIYFQSNARLYSEDINGTDLKDVAILNSGTDTFVSNASNFSIFNNNLYFNKNKNDVVWVKDLTTLKEKELFTVKATHTDLTMETVGIYFGKDGLYLQNFYYQSGDGLIEDVVKTLYSELQRYSYDGQYIETLYDKEIP